MNRFSGFQILGSTGSDNARVEKSDETVETVSLNSLPLIHRAEARCD
jgi:hypothetical protein